LDLLRRSTKHTELLSLKKKRKKKENIGKNERRKEVKQTGRSYNVATK
jgi:hypothetical protein